MTVITGDDVLRDTVCGLLHWSGYRTLAPTEAGETAAMLTAPGVAGLFLDLDVPDLDLRMLLRAAGASHDKRLHAVVTQRQRPTREELAPSAALLKTLSYLPFPVEMFEFRRAFSRFIA